jgi:hypothetical protein
MSTLRSLRAPLFMLVAVSALLPAQVGGAEPTVLFPPSLLEQARDCKNLIVGHRETLSEFEAVWFSRELILAGEASLADERSADAVRFLWLRSFHRPIVVRIDDVGSSSPRMLAIEFSDERAENDRIVRREVRQLKADEANAVRALITESRVFEPRAEDCNIGLDGAQWVLERQQTGKYALVHQWSPENGPVLEVGTLLLELTGWDVGERY